MNNNETKNLTKEQKQERFEQAMAEGKEKIFLKFRVNENRFKELTKLGVQLITRNENAIVIKHELKAVEMGQDAYAYDRKDATGRKRPDSGILIMEETMTSAYNLLRTALELGWSVTVNMYKKENKNGHNDKMYFLTIVFEKNAKEQNTLSAKLHNYLFEKIVDRTYEHLQVWSNPDQTLTFNYAHAKDTKPEHMLELAQIEGEIKLSYQALESYKQPKLNEVR